MKRKETKAINGMKILAQVLLVLALLLYVGNVVIASPFMAISKEQKSTLVSLAGATSNKKMEGKVIQKEAYNENEATQIINMTVTPMRGGSTLEENDIVHEGEYIRYNIAVRNNTDQDINNAKVVATIPEGVEYGELSCNFEEIAQPYEYTFNKELKEKEINIEEIKSGETKNIYYEVKVKDLEEGINTEEITTNIKAYIGTEVVQNFEITNTVEPADTKLFLGSCAYYLNGHIYGLNIASDTQEEVEVKIHLPKGFVVRSIGEKTSLPEKFDFYWAGDPEQGANIVYENPDLMTNSKNEIGLEIMDNNIIKAKLKTNCRYDLFGGFDSSIVSKETMTDEATLSAYAETADGKYVSNGNTTIVPVESIEVSMTSNNADQKVKQNDEIEYDISIKSIMQESEINIGQDDWQQVNLQDYLPDALSPVSVSYETWDIVTEEDGNITGLEKKTIEEDISTTSVNDDENKNPNVNISMIIPRGETSNIKIKTKAGMVYDETTIENMAKVEGENIATKLSEKVSHTILPYNYGEQEPEEPETPTTPDPEQPAEPEKPSRPITPETPETPEEPETPSKPTTPTTPEKPEKPATTEPTNKTNTSKNCDFEINKTISKITVKTVSGVKEYTFDNEKLAKTEIRAKEMNGATVVIEYKIIVKNVGDVAGTVGEIVDYLPEGLTFSSQLNKEWTQSTNGQLKCTSNPNYIMQAGEAKTLTLIATKQMQTNATGSFINKAEIKNIATSAGIKEKNTQNNTSQAEVIISTSTGAYVYISIAVIALIALTIIATILYKKGKINLHKIKETSFIIAFMMVLLLSQTKTLAFPGSTSFYYPPNVFSGCLTWQGGPGGAGGTCIEPSTLSEPGSASLKYTVVSRQTVTKIAVKNEVELANDENQEVEMKIDGNNVIYGPLTYDAKNVEEFVLRIKDLNGNYINGWSICDGSLSNGSNVTFYITGPKELWTNGISDIELEGKGTRIETYETRTWRRAVYEFNAPGYQDVISNKEEEDTPSYEDKYVKHSKKIHWKFFRGGLEIIKLDKDDHTKTLEDVEFTISGPSGTFNEKTDKDGRIVLDNLKMGTYTIVETSTPHYGYRAEIDVSKGIGNGQLLMVELENTKYTGNLRIDKKDPDSGKPLAGVQFRIKGPDGYLAVKGMSTVTGEILLTDKAIYDASEDGATIFITDENGMIGLYDIFIGTYTVEEISVGDNEYYEVDDNYISWETTNGGSGKGNTATVTVNRQLSTYTSDASIAATHVDILTIYNRQKYVDLSGLVWEDMVQEKGSKYNSVYDSGDNLVNNVDVRIIENGNVASRKYRGQPMPSEARSGDAGTGAYKFEKLEIDKLKDYMIEFTYNGMSYESIPAIDLVNPNGSKALEGSARDEFNSRFATITNEAHSEISGESNAETLQYDKIEAEYRSKLNYEGNPVYGYDGQRFPINDIAEKYLIKSNTQNAYGGGLDKAKSPEEIRKNNIEEITDINQGIYEREQVDLFLTNDINSVMAKIKGYTHIYEYGNRFAHRDENPDDFYKVGVKFGEKYTDKYSQPIYRSDYNYQNNGNNELEVYITYQIDLTNQTTGITTTVNSIVDYYDPQYEIATIGTDYNRENGTVSGELEYNEQNYDNNFNKVDIEANIQLQPQETKPVYVQFKLTRAKIAEILKDLPEGAESVTLNNVAEITSYSSTKDDKVYGMIDKNSNPNNATPGNEATYENDTDAAPDFRLKVAQDRHAEGIVFLDSTSSEMKTGEERLGDGKYEEGEAKVKDVIVRLKEGDNIVKELHTSSDEANAGEYRFTDFTPGEYTIEYEWSNNEATDGTQINVYDYKGTIYNNPERAENEFWYKELGVRNSDAKDDYSRREKLDGYTNTVNFDIDNKKNNEGNEIKTMISTTPTMNIKIEYSESPDITDIDSIIKHEIKEVDFGIVERPRQQLALNKEISKVTVSLANGQKVIETTVNSEGELVGNNLKNKRASQNDNGFVQIEMDNELIQGATIEVEYELSIKNNSEVDYINKDYYLYGTDKTNILKLTPSKLIDYLDKNVAFDEVSNNKWKQLNTAEDGGELKGKVDPTVYETGLGKPSKINEKRVLYTENYDGKALAPSEEAEKLGIKVSKLLTSKFGNQNFIEGNEAEIIEITKNGGRTPTKTENQVTTHTTPGKYIPGNSDNPGGPNEPDNNTSEYVTVVPNTGANLNYILPISVGIVAVVILGAGVYFIKKKVIK